MFVPLTSDVRNVGGSVQSSIVGGSISKMKKLILCCSMIKFLLLPITVTLKVQFAVLLKASLTKYVTFVIPIWNLYSVIFVIAGSVQSKICKYVLSANKDVIFGFF